VSFYKDADSCGMTFAAPLSAKVLVSKHVFSPKRYRGLRVELARRFLFFFVEPFVERSGVNWGGCRPLESVIVQVKWLVRNGSPLRGRIGMARRLAFGCARLGGWPAGAGGRRISVFVAVVAVASVVPVSLLVSTVRRDATRTVDCCHEQERQTYEFLWLSLHRTGCRRV